MPRMILNETMRRLALVLGGLLVVQTASAHHSSLGLYDVDRVIEIEGVVTSVRWRNPHPAYTVAVREQGGETVEWNVEVGGAITTLRMRGVTRDVVSVGDAVRIAGEASTRGLPEMFAHNVLLENGQEVLLGIRATPRWPAGLRGDLYESEADEATIEDARQRADGVFRVWAADLADVTSFLLYRDKAYPLTDWARGVQAQWDARSSPYLGCRSRGMPYLMNNPYPLEFVKRGEDILLRMEMYDAERFIRMDGVQPAIPAFPSLYGHSRGRWEGRTLVVETDSIDAPYFDGADGTPQSGAMRVVEFFTPSESEDRLDYRLVVNDSKTFTEEMEFTRYWIWRPGLRVEPFNCED